MINAWIIFFFYFVLDIKILIYYEWKMIIWTAINVPNLHLEQKSCWINVSLEKSLLGRMSLGQSCPWTTLPWTNVATPVLTIATLPRPSLLGITLISLVYHLLYQKEINDSISWLHYINTYLKYMSENNYFIWAADWWGILRMEKMKEEKGNNKNISHWCLNQLSAW